MLSTFAYFSVKEEQETGLPLSLRREARLGILADVFKGIRGNTFTKLCRYEYLPVRVGGFNSERYRF